MSAVWTTNLVALLFGVGMYAVFAFLPEFLQTPKSSGYGFGASTTASGLYLIPMTTTMFIFGLISGRVAARTCSKLVLLVGSLFTIPAFAILAFFHAATWEILAATSLLGVGLGFAFSAMSNLIVESVPATQVGVASGMNANIRTIGGSIGAAVMGSIVTAKLQASGLPVSSGYRNGFAFLVVAAALATVACILIPRVKGDELAVIDHAGVVEHSETALVAGAVLVDERFDFADVDEHDLR
jgi:MFS family permease